MLLHIPLILSTPFYIYHKSTKKYFASSKTHREIELLDSIEEADTFDLKKSVRMHEMYVHTNGHAITMEREQPRRNEPGIPVHLDEEHKDGHNQLFLVVQMPASEVRLVIGEMCLTVDVDSMRVMATRCSDEDDGNLFVLINAKSAHGKKEMSVDMAKLEALREAARVSQKVREKLGMDYLDSLTRSKNRYD